MTNRRRALALGLAAAAAGVLAAILATTHAGATTSNAQVNVRSTALGRILVDARGRTLYMFARDRNGKSACYAVCAHFWPPLIATKAPKTGAGLKASLFKTTVRKDGKMQVVFRGHPLYRFLKDTKAGQTNGQGLNLAGGLWWVLSPRGTVIRAMHSAPTTTSTTTSSTTTTTYP